LNILVQKLQIWSLRFLKKNELKARFFKNLRCLFTNSGVFGVKFYAVPPVPPVAPVPPPNPYSKWLEIQNFELFWLKNLKNSWKKSEMAIPWYHYVRIGVTQKISHSKIFIYFFNKSSQKLLKKARNGHNFG
jgi:hypothetical protein